MSRVLQPTILETKQELLLALKTGAIQSAKYNVLSEAEKTFVELVVFGDYTGDQAIRVLDPMQKHPGVIANKMMGNPDVAAAIEELTIQKDRKFMAEISTARDMALAKLKYIMNTTQDEALAAATAKTILDKAEKSINKNDKEEQVGRVQFNIQVENLYAKGQTPTMDEQVIIPIEDDEYDIDPSPDQPDSFDETTSDERKKELKENRKRQAQGKLPINPDTGLPYTLAYEAVDLYNKKEED